MFSSRFFVATAAVAAALIPATGALAETDPDDPFTGLYIGVHAGFSRGSFSIDGRSVALPSETIPGENEGDPNIVIPAGSQAIEAQSAGTGISPIAGGQLGFNFATPTMLFGVEADISYASGGGTSSLALTETVADGSDLPARSLTSDVNIDAEFSGSARLRVGLRQQDLVYFVTAGLAAARIDVTSTGSTGVANGEDGVRTVTASDRATHTGYTGGVGILGWFGGNALGSVELRYTDYGSKTYDLAGSVDSPVVPTDIGLTAIQLLVRMSYRF